MYIDAGAALLVLIYGILGYRRGLVGALISLAGMIVGYIAAIYFARDGAVVLAARTGIAPIFALPLASLLIYLLVTRAFALLRWAVRKAMSGDKEDSEALGTMDKVGGLGFGLLKGTLIVGLVIWGLPNLVSPGKLGVADPAAGSAFTKGVRSAVETAGRYGASLMTDDPNAQSVMARVMAEPRAAVQETAALAANPTLKAMLSDPNVQGQVKTQGLISVVNSPRFDAVLADEGVQTSLKKLGFQPADGQHVTRQELGRTVVTVGAQMQRQMAQIQNAASTKEMQAFLADPAVQEQLKKGDLTQVLKDPRLAKILGLSGTPAPEQERSPGAKPPVTRL